MGPLSSLEREVKKSGGILVISQRWPQERFELFKNLLNIANFFTHREIRTFSVCHSQPLTASHDQIGDFRSVGEPEDQISTLEMNRVDSPAVRPNPQSGKFYQLFDRSGRRAESIS